MLRRLVSYSIQNTSGLTDIVGLEDFFIMSTRKLFIPLILVLFFVAGAATVSAQDWQKLGEKDVNFGLDHDTISATGKGKIREIHMAVKYSPIKLRRVVINYKDGTKQDLEYLEDLDVGKESRAITIDGDGHVIHSIDLWYETDAMKGKKAKVTVYGRG